MKNRLMIVPAVLLTLTGCGATMGTINNALVEKTHQEEMYRIYDIKTSVERHVVADAASDGLGRNVSGAREARPIPSGNVKPMTPGRFQLVDPLAGSQLSALARSGGEVGIKVATCDGAVWTAKARRENRGWYSVDVTTCLFEYEGGYHLDIYAVKTEKEGGIFEISRKAAGVVSGNASEWTQLLLDDVAREIRRVTGAEVEYVEGYPKPSGTPWLDDGKAVSSL